MNLPLLSPALEPATVLVVDDDDEARGQIAARLRARGFRVNELADGRALFDRLLSPRPLLPAPAVVVAAMFLPGMTSLEICAAAHDTGLPVRFVLTTSVASDELRNEARRAGAAAVFDQPVELQRLVDVVGELVDENAV